MSEELNETEVNDENLEADEEATSQEPEEEKKSITDIIKEKIKSFAKKDEPAEKQVVIPDEFSKAALNQGWSSEDISEFAKNYTEEELTEMIPTLIGADSEESEETVDTLDEETEDTKVEDSQEDEKTKKLLERIEALEKAQGQSREQEQKQELIGDVQKASQLFDEASKEFEVFGKTDELPKFPDGRLVQTSPAVKARNEVFDLAYLLKGAGMSFDEALEVSLNSYKGKNLQTAVKRSVIKDLKNKEKKLSGKRTSHDSGKTELSGPEVIKAILEKNNK